MKLSQTLHDELNLQINRELSSEYAYLAMAAYFESINLDGFTNFFKVQAAEEHFHAMKIFNFLNAIGGRVKLLQINEPKTDFNNALEVFELALHQEEHIEYCIDKLMDLAIKDNNHAVMSFLKWYVDEQVEEIDLFNKLIAKVKIAGNEGSAILMVDAELAKRKASPEILSIRTDDGEGE
ncbi:MAG TPA: ferritin [Ignavibacteria bacterium]|nr:ferritin [Ignavibacteria bacterium]